MFTTDYFIFSILIAVCAFVYTNFLIDTGEVLGEWNAFVYNILGNEERLLNEKGYHWAYKAFVFCERCVAGQISLWSFLMLHFNEYREVSFALVLQHILFITLTIFLTIIVKSFYKKIIE